MNAMQRSARLNNEGCSWMGAMKYEKAIEAFLEAIKLVEDLPGHASVPISIDSYELTACDARVVVKDLDDTEFYAFNPALEFSAGGGRNNGEEPSTLCQRAFSFHMAITVYNVAVAYHAFGIRGNKNMSRLEKAFQFYEMSLDLADKIAIYSDHLQRMMVASLNNQIHILFDMRRVKEVPKKLDLLQTMIHNLESAGDDETFIINKDHFQEWAAAVEKLGRK